MAEAEGLYYLALAFSIIVGAVIALVKFGKSIWKDIQKWRENKEAEKVLCSNCGEKVKPKIEARKIFFEYEECKVCPICDEEL